MTYLKKGRINVQICFAIREIKEEINMAAKVTKDMTIGAVLAYLEEHCQTVISADAVRHLAEI